MLKTKNLFTNKYLKQYSEASEFNDLLSIAKIDQAKKNQIQN